MMDKIKRISRFFRILFQIAFFAEPFLAAIFWFTLGSHIDYYTTKLWPLPVLPHYVTINLTTRILGFVVSILPAAIIMFGLYQMIKIFRSYEKGDIFTANNAVRFCKLGWIFLSYFFLQLLYDALISLVLTFQNGPQKREILLTFGNNNFYPLMVGGLIILIGWIMKEAAKISEEQNYTV